MDLKLAIIAQARALGFAQVGVARAEALPAAPLDHWLDQGYHAGMSYMTNHHDMRLDPRIMLPGARSVLVVALNYYTPFEPASSPELARISRYAWGDDYHTVVKKRLKKLFAYMVELVPAAEGRLCVDSAPVLEKAWALQAGIGWMGKHSCIIAPPFGSWIFLGEIVTNLELEPDTPVKNRCGTCRLCMEACPTGAIVAPHVIDSRRCLSYLTIEHKGEIPAVWQPALGNHVCGCDICQEVCPWNRQHGAATAEHGFYPRPIWQDARLKTLADWSELEFNSHAQQSPVKRLRFEGFKRNIAVGLKNADQRM